MVLGDDDVGDSRELNAEAVSDLCPERLAADESFATSILWGGEIVALDEDGRSLVDFTTFESGPLTDLYIEVTEAVLERIDGRRLKFTVSARDSGGIVAAGKITRVVVDRDRFMGKCCS